MTPFRITIEFKQEGEKLGCTPESVASHFTGIIEQIYYGKVGVTDHADAMWEPPCRLHADGAPDEALYCCRSPPPLACRRPIE